MTVAHRVALLFCALIATSTLVTSRTIPCPKLKPHNATSIFDLRPADIKVAMALGDSITAAFSVFGTVAENRGVSWSIGGDADAISFANILRQTSPNPVFGPSLGTHFPEIPYTPYHAQDVLNAAQSGALVQNLPFQVARLVKILKSSSSTTGTRTSSTSVTSDTSGTSDISGTSGTSSSVTSDTSTSNNRDTSISDNSNIGGGSVDFERDWKVLTILIGANNACWVCKKAFFNILDNADHFEDYLRRTLEKVQQEIPRVFVNVVPLLKLAQLYNVSKESTYCQQMHAVVGWVECPCAFTRNTTTHHFLDAMVQEYNVRTKKVAKEMNDKYLASGSFAVVVQPFLEDIEIPSLSWLSKLDCFVRIPLALTYCHYEIYFLFFSCSLSTFLFISTSQSILISLLCNVIVLVFCA